MVDSFFTDPSKNKRKRAGRNAAPAKSRKPQRRREEVNQEDDEEITSSSEDEHMSKVMHGEDEESSEDEFANETEADKRRRLAKDYLHTLEKEQLEEMGDGDEYAFDAKALDREIISKRLKEDVAESKGRIYRRLCEHLNFEKASETGRISTCKQYALTSVAGAQFPHVYTVSKDAVVAKWTINKENGSAKIVKMNRGDRHVARQSPEDQKEYTGGHFDEVLAVAVSKDGRHVVTGGRDKRVIIWSGEKLRPVRVIDTRDRKGAVLGLVFRRNTSDFYAACADLKVRTYNADQMAQIETLFGHQDEVSDVCALGQERCVSVGSRDRTAILWKIPDETRLTFRGADASAAEIDKSKRVNRIFEGSIDCCSMIDETLFVTGSDNGSVALWATGKKKPIFVIREAHGRDDPLLPHLASADLSTNSTVPTPQPRPITAICAIPYSDVFFTASYDGKIKAWKVTEDNRKFELAHNITGPNGIVNRMTVLETGSRNKEEFVLVAALSKEPRLGRWLKVSGKNGLFITTISRE